MIYIEFMRIYLLYYNIKDVIASIALVQMRSLYGIIQINKENYITEFKEKHH